MKTTGCRLASHVAFFFLLVFYAPAFAVAGSADYALKVTSADTVNLMSGTYSAGSSSGEAYGIYGTGSLLNIGTFGTDATVNAATTGTDAYSCGLYATDISIATLAGTVNATAANANQAFGLYAADDIDDAIISIGTLSGTITATGTDAGAAGIWATGVDCGGVVDITTLSGTVSATAYDSHATGIYSNTIAITTLSGTVSATASGTVTTSRNIYTNGEDSEGGISLLTYDTGAVAYGLESNSIDIGTLSGTVSATSADGPAYGLYGSDTGINIGTLSGTVSATSLGGTYTIADSYGSTTVNAPAYGLNAYGIGIGTLSGTVSAASADGTAYGLYSTGTLNGGDAGTAMLLSGAVKASGVTGAYALYAEDAVNVYITGTLTATASDGDAYAIKTGDGDDAVTLGTGADLTGAVDLGEGTDTLTLMGKGTASASFVNIENLVVGGEDVSTNWIWAASSGSTNFDSIAVRSGASLSIGNGQSVAAGTLTVDSGATLNLAAYGQGAAGVTATTATITGTLGVDPTAAAVGTTSQILSAGTLSTAAVVSSNPNYTVTRTDSDASGTVTVSTAFSPRDDQSTLGTTASLASAQAFANVAQTRGLTMLADSGQDNEEIMVASSGSLSGLLAPSRPETSWGMYLQPVFSQGSRDGDSEGYDATMYGLEIGADRKYGESGVFGVMAGIGTGKIDFNGSNFVSGDSEVQTLYTAGVYGGYKLADWTFADTLSTTYTTHDSSRNAGLAQTARADYDSWLTANQFTAIYHWQPADHWEIAPRAGLNVTHLHRGGFSETGAANAVSYDDLDKTFADGTLGVRVKYDAQAEDTRITPYAGLGVIHSLGSGDITVRQYLSTTSAQVTTENDANRLTPELGVTFSKGTAAFTMGYAGEYGETTDSHSIFGMLRMDF